MKKWQIWTKRLNHLYNIKLYRIIFFCIASYHVELHLIGLNIHHSEGQSSTDVLNQFLGRWITSASVIWSVYDSFCESRSILNIWSPNTPDEPENGSQRRTIFSTVALLDEHCVQFFQFLHFHESVVQTVWKSVQQDAMYYQSKRLNVHKMRKM